MNKLLTGSLAVGALIAIAGFRLVAPNLTDVVNKLNAAEGLTVTLASTTVGGGSTSTDIAFAKPNKIRIETDEQLIVGDGSTLTVLVKKLNKYFTKPQSDKVVATYLSGEEYRLWNSFFNKDVFKGATVKSATALITRKGKKYEEHKVVLDATKGRTMTIYVEAASGLPSTILFDTKGSTASKVVEATASLQADPNVFTFKAPKTSEEVAEADLVALRWFHYDEAMALAGSLGKKVYIHFGATWCGPCKMLEQQVYTTEEFKSVAANFVLCHVDVDEEPALAQKYGISGIPDIRILDKDGTQLGQMVGYRPTEELVAELNKYK